MFPPASATADDRLGGVNADPGDPEVGCWENTSLYAVPTEIAMGRSPRIGAA